MAHQFTKFSLRFTDNIHPAFNCAIHTANLCRNYGESQVLKYGRAGCRRPPFSDGVCEFPKELVGVRGSASVGLELPAAGEYARAKSLSEERPLGRWQTLKSHRLRQAATGGCRWGIGHEKGPQSAKN